MMKKNLNKNGNKRKFIEILNQYLNKGEISNWSCREGVLEKYNIYVEENYKIESILNSKREEFVFTIYKEFNGNLLGDSSFSINVSDGEEKFRNEVEDAIFISSKSTSKKYDLPKNSDVEVSNTDLDDNIFFNEEFISKFLAEDLEEFYLKKLYLLKDIVNNSCNDKIKFKVNNIEFLNSISENSLITSTGISKSFKKNSSYMEMVLTGIELKSGNEKEYVIYKKLNNALKFDFEEFFLDSIDILKNSLSANEPESFEGEVVLTNTACIDFFNPDLTMNSLVGHCSARLKYFKISKLELGDEIVTSKYDKFTIFSNPLLRFNSASTPFDEDGICAKRTCILEDNKVKTLFASKQFADYLGISPIGPFGSIEINSGKTSEKDFFKGEENCIEIVSFASFVPDLVSGDFSAEVRVGYLLKNGKKIPFRGGLFSGNVFEVCKEVLLSKERVEDCGYLGPKSIKFFKGKIVGM